MSNIVNNIEDGSLSPQFLNNILIDDDDIINLSSEFPRSQHLSLKNCECYTSSTLSSIFIDNRHGRGDSFDLIRVNVGGLEAHFNDFFTFLSAFDFAFDVICLSGAHLCVDKTYLDSDGFHIGSYTMYGTFGAIKHGGCVVCVRDACGTNMMLSLSGSSSISDYLYVNISILGSVGPLCVGVYYRHNRHDKNALHKFIDQLDARLYSADIRSGRVVVVGDVSMDLTRLSTNSDIELCFGTLTCHSFESHVGSHPRGCNMILNQMPYALLLWLIICSQASRNAGALLVMSCALVAITVQTF